MTRVIGLGILLLVQWAPLVRAQESGASPLARSTTAWVNGGIGVGSLGPAFSLNVSVQPKAGLFRRDDLATGRTAATVDILGGDTRWDLGLLYGLGTRPGRVHGLVAAGVGLVGHSEGEGIDFNLEFSSRAPVEPTAPLSVLAPVAGAEIHNVVESPGVVFGVPVEAQLFWRPSANLGLGLYGFANLNARWPFAGVTASIQLGRLR